MSDNVIYSNPGDPIEKEYILKDDGTIEVVGTNDLRQEIESYRDSVDLKRIFDSLVDADDPRIHVNRGIYMDTTVLPKTASALSDLGKYNSRKISGLPPELRNLTLKEFTELSNEDIVSIMDESKNKKVNNDINNNEVNNND